MRAAPPLCRDARGDAAARAVVERCLGFLRDRLGPRLVGLILTGSFSRGEGTVVAVNGHLRVLGDIEFLVVLPRRRDERAHQARLAAAAAAGDADDHRARGLHGGRRRRHAATVAVAASAARAHSEA